MHRYVDDTTRSLQDIFSHITKNSHLLHVVPYYYVFIGKYDVTSITYVCVQFVLISRNENSIFLPQSMLRHLTLLYFYKFINRTIVGNNEFDKTCVLYSPLQLSSETFLIPVRN